MMCEKWLQQTEKVKRVSTGNEQLQHTRHISRGTEKNNQSIEIVKHDSRICEEPFSVIHDLSAKNNTAPFVNQTVK